MVTKIMVIEMDDGAFVNNDNSTNGYDSSCHVGGKSDVDVL